MKPDVRTRNLDRLVDNYLEAQEKRDYYQELLSEADRKLADAQEEIYGDGSLEHWTMALQSVQSRIQTETDRNRKRRCVYLAMLINNWIESDPI